MITASNDAWQRKKDEKAKMQEQYKSLQTGRSALGKTFDEKTRNSKTSHI